jgi:hypothetical protein
MKTGGGMVEILKEIAVAAVGVSVFWIFTVMAFLL